MAKIDPTISTGNLLNLAAMAITLLTLGGGFLIAWGELRETAKNTKERITAVEVGTGQRLDALERADRQATRTADTVRERIGDIGGDVKSLNERTASQQRQLDRIERSVDVLVANGRKTGTP